MSQRCLLKISTPGTLGPTFPTNYFNGQPLTLQLSRLNPPVNISLTSSLTRVCGQAALAKVLRPESVPAAEVNSLTSAETELPFNYYTLPFCEPPEGTRKSLSTINPGTILTGAQIQNSPYNFSMLVRASTVHAAGPIKLA